MSSDDDVLDLLPGAGGGPRRQAPARRARNFTAMLNDSTSSDDVKFVPRGAAANGSATANGRPKVSLDSIAAPAPEAKAPTPPSSDDDTATNTSIQFEAVSEKVEAAGTDGQSSDFDIGSPQQSPPSAPRPAPAVTAPAVPTNPTPAVVAPVQAVIPQAAPSPPPQAPPAKAPPKAPPVEQAAPLEAAPLPFPPIPQAGLGGPLPPSADRQLHYSTMHPSPAPMRTEDGVDELLARAQQRLRERQFHIPTNARVSPSPALRAASAARATTPLRRDPTQPPPVLAPPDAAAEHRVARENLRLVDEIGFLTAENHRLRGGPVAATATASSTLGSAVVSVETTKLQMQLEVARRQCRDAELEAQRTRRQLEEQVRDVTEHRSALQEEIASYIATMGQYEHAARDKDAQLAAEQTTGQRLRAELDDQQQELARHREDLQRLSVEWAGKMERQNAMIDDMKRQRAHLQEMTDKAARERDQAVADRRRHADELRALHAERSRERDQAAEEILSLRREVERFKGLLHDKERVLGAQLAEERRAKDIMQSRLLRLEELATKDASSGDSQVRALTDEHRAAMARLQDQLHEAQTTARAAEGRVLEVQGFRDAESERERLESDREFSDRLYKLRAELDAALVALRTAEMERDSYKKDAARYKEELDGASGIVQQWRAAKERAESQNTQLTATIALLMANDEAHETEKRQLRDGSLRLEGRIRALEDEVAGGAERERQFAALASENTRLSAECGRLAQERDELVDENGKMATEVLRWRDEVKDMLIYNRGHAGRPNAAALGNGRSASHMPLHHPRY